VIHQDRIPHPYEALTPELVLTAVEQIGVRCDGRLLALNSYENRVYQVGIEEGAPLVAKFYRPERWSNSAIIEEHEFTRALAAAEIPVVEPITGAEGQTLFEYAGFRYALYPRRGGHWPELDSRDNLMWMGRMIARIHALGAIKPFRARPSISIAEFGTESYQFVLERGFVPAELQHPYRTLAEDVLRQVQACFDRAGPYRTIRLHGDCHAGNVLWTDDGPHFVDFDDARNGPAIQDLWMLLSGDRPQMVRCLADLLDGYTEFFDFDVRQLHLIEALRTLRMIHYSAWLARRWGDPTFARNFPWFGEPRYWEEQILNLREQAAVMDEEPLVYL
jgi:Ser/Thr protein kinase RdoA (MazF antagonist)